MVGKLSNLILLIHFNNHIRFGEFSLGPWHVILLYLTLLDSTSYDNLVKDVVTFINCNPADQMFIDIVPGSAQQFI